MPGGMLMVVAGGGAYFDFVMRVVIDCFNGRASRRGGGGGGIDFAAVRRLGGGIDFDAVASFGGGTSVLSFLDRVGGNAAGSGMLLRSRAGLVKVVVGVDFEFEYKSEVEYDDERRSGGGRCSGCAKFDSSASRSSFERSRSKSGEVKEGMRHRGLEPLVCATCGGRAGPSLESSRANCVLLSRKSSQSDKSS